MSFDTHGDEVEAQFAREKWDCSLDLFPLPFSDTCDECLAEAWEHMTYGGIQIAPEKSPYRFTYGNDIPPLVEYHVAH